MTNNLVYRLLYPFTAEEDGELSAKEAEIVHHYSDGNDSETPEGWTLVKNAAGDVGFVPSAYIQIIEDTDTKKPQNVVQPVTNLKSISSSTFSSQRLNDQGVMRTDIPTGQYDSIRSMKQDPSASTAPTFMTPQLNLNTSSFDHTDMHMNHNPMFRSTVATSRTSIPMHSTNRKLQRTISSKITSTTATAKAAAAIVVPHLSTSAERESFTDLSFETASFFERLLMSQSENYDSCKKTLDEINSSLKTSLQSQSNLISTIADIQEKLEDEKKKLISSIEDKKHNDLVSRSSRNFD